VNTTGGIGLIVIRDLLPKFRGVKPSTIRVFREDKIIEEGKWWPSEKPRAFWWYRHIWQV